MTVSDILVEYYDESAGSWKTVDARSWKVDKDGPQSFWEFELVTDESLLGEIPAESDIRAKNQGVWVFAGRTDDGGELNSNGNFEVTAHSYGHKQLRDRITISKNSNNTNLDIMGEIVNKIEYRADDGSLKTYNLNTPSTSYDLPNYSYDGKAKNAKQEMERWFNWTLYTAPQGEAYYEPIEHGSSGITIDTSTDNAEVDKYKPEITENVVSDVRVTGTDPNGNKIDKLASASSPDAVNYVHKRVDFTVTSSEAQTLTEQFLQPNASDRVEIFLRFQDYQDTFFNESIDFSDPRRTNGNTETFFVHEEEITQSGGLKLTLEKAPNFSIITEFDDQEKDLGRDRAKVFFGDTSDVTGQTGNTGPDVDGQSGDTGPDVDGQSSDTGPNVSGSTSFGGQVSLIDDDSDSSTFTSGLGSTFTEIAELAVSGEKLNEVLTAVSIFIRVPSAVTGLNENPVLAPVSVVDPDSFAILTV